MLLYNQINHLLMIGTEETVGLNDSLDVPVTTAISDTQGLYNVIRLGNTVPIPERDIINTYIGPMEIDGLYAVYHHTKDITVIAMKWNEQLLILSKIF